MTQTVLALVYLAWSVTSLTWHAAHLHRLGRPVGADAPQYKVAWRVTHRTLSWRVGVASCWVCVGLAALLLGQLAAVVGLIIFCGLQTLWWPNSAADVRALRRMREVRR